MGERLPWLMVGAVAYLVAFPFMSIGAAELVLVALTAAFIATQQFAPAADDPGYGFLLPVLPFIAAYVLAVLRAPDQVVASDIMSYELPGLVLFVIMLRHPRWPWWGWALGFSLFSAGISLAVLVGYVRFRMGAPVPPVTGPAEATVFLANNELLIVPNDILVVAIVLVFALSAVAGPAPRAVRWTGMATVALTFMALAVMRSRTGLVVACVEMLIAGIAWRRLLPWLAGVLALMAAADVVLGLGALQKLLLANSLDNHGVIGRFGLWASAWGMFCTAPFFGHGAQSFGPMHGAFLPGWSPRFPERRVMWAHSLFLETLADQGLFGAAALVIMFLLPLWKLCKDVVNRSSSDHLRREQLFAAAGLVGFLGAAGLELSFIRRFVSVVMFGVLGFAFRVLRTPRS